MSLESAFVLPRSAARRAGSLTRPWDVATSLAPPRPDDDAADEGADATRYRAIFISDCHLGTPGCQARALLEFLRHTESDYLYLVGDIVDGWQLKRRWYWHQLHNDVVQKVLRKVRKGTQVVYVPGNHDEAARAYVGIDFGGIAIRAEAVHVTRRGVRLLVTHGDLFDAVVTCARWLALLGDHLYTLILKMNQHFNAARARLGLPYWSLSQFLKRRVKNAVCYIASFEEALAREARSRGFDGVVCGHIHHAEMRQIGDILYCNSGDWVESLTALVEAQDGTLSIVRWPERANRETGRGLRTDSVPGAPPAESSPAAPAAAPATSTSTGELSCR